MDATQDVAVLEYTIDEIIRHHLAILGKTGSGKTSTEKLVVEKVVARGARVCVLDTIKSDWWGVTSSADGKRAGLPFKILGGPRAHAVIGSGAGKAVGQLVATGKLPLTIVDMAYFEAGGVQRFFVDFAEALFRNMRGVLYLVIEEAHEVAPKERAGFGAENMAIHWAKKLATAGRSKGIRLIVATQTAQQLHNRVLGSCETLIAHRLFAPADKKPVIDWLKNNADKTTMERVESSLARLPTGTAWVCSAEAGIFGQFAFPKFSTFDNTQTPTEDARAVDVQVAPVDQSELMAILGAAAAEEAAKDPKFLQAEIERLQRQLAAAPSSGNLDEATRVALLEDGRKMGCAEAFNEFAVRVGAVERAWEVVKPLTRGIDELGELIGNCSRAIPFSSIPVHRPGAVATPLSSGASAQRVLERPSFSVDVADRFERKDEPGIPLPKGERVCLIAIAQHVERGVTRRQLTVLTGYKRSSRDAYIQRLRERKYVEESHERILVTRAGVHALGSDYEPLPKGKALQQRVLSELPEGERRVLELVISKYPAAVDRDKISDATDYKRSSRDAYLQRLSARELIDTSRDGVTASADLF